MSIPRWQDQYTYDQLVTALQLAYQQQRDPAHLTDTAWHAEQSRRIRLISAEITNRDEMIGAPDPR